jgi:hypothetical protein
MTGTSPIARAIAELETERENLRVRIVKVDTAIASLRELFHLPADRLATAPAPSNGNGHDTGINAKIRAALAHGPLSPSALATAVGMERHTLRTFIADLERTGTIVSSGATANRRIALAADAAKEAP